MTHVSRETLRQVQLMQDALQIGWTSQKAAQALKSRILRDERYLAYRRRCGLHTATDAAIYADLYALAWAACYLEEGIHDLPDEAGVVESSATSERGTMPSERGQREGNR